MNFSISPETSYGVIRFVGRCSGIWPFPIKRRFFNTDYLCWFCFLNHACVFLFLLYSLYVSRDNISAATNTWVEFSGFIDIMSVVIISKYQKPRLKVRQRECGTGPGHVYYYLQFLFFRY